MPNWCSNNVTLVHPDPTMIERARTAFSEGRFLEEFIPNPDGEWNYSFSVENWGTKWDVGGDEIADIDNGLMLTFDSAWGPPIAAYQALENMGFIIEATYYESGMCFAGQYAEGEDDYYEFGGLSADEVADLLPPDLDEAYGISENIREWQSEDEDYIADVEDDIEPQEDVSQSDPNDPKI